MYRSIKKKIHKYSNTKMLGGFTLTELIVTVGIMALMLTVLVRAQSGYTEKTSLVNAADQLASTIREAQVYSTAVREHIPGSANFSSYGVSVNLIGGVVQPSYFFFADKFTIGTYNSSWTYCPVTAAEWSECLKLALLPQGIVIQSICIISSNDTEDCTTPKRADITFVRPSTEAKFVVFNSGGVIIDTSAAKAVKLKLRSPSAYETSIVVYKVGQISVI